MLNQRRGTFIWRLQVARSAQKSLWQTAQEVEELSRQLEATQDRGYCYGSQPKPSESKKTTMEKDGKG